MTRSTQPIGGVAGNDGRHASSGADAQSGVIPGTTPEPMPGAKPEATPGSKPGAAPGTDQPTLNPQEQKEVEKLKQRDREVKNHEQTHKAQLGPYATGGPYYEYTTGPDNKQYAVGGSVSVDTSKESTPERTIQKAQVLKRASMAVAEPSGADKAVASKAQRMEMEARAEIAEKNQQGRRDISRALNAYQQAGPAKETSSQSLSLMA